MTAADAAGLMRRLDVGVVPVLDGDRLVGLVTDRDLVIRVMGDRKDPDNVQLGEIVTKSPVTVTPDTKLSEALELMTEHRVRRLPVVKGSELVGILSMGDVAIASSSDRKMGEALGEISESSSTMDLSGGPDRGTPERSRRTGTEG
jgi:signal-transduction protein with cAMP-binding, CBS, and nucleotidyltransferase domain